MRGKNLSLTKSDRVPTLCDLDPHIGCCGRRLAKGARSYRCDGRRYKPRVSGAHRSQLDSSAFHRGFIDDSLLRALVISGWVFASARSRGVDLQKAKTDERGANTGVHQPPATRASRCLARRLRVDASTKYWGSYLLAGAVQLLRNHKGVAKLTQTKESAP